jgi:hypothetical protein
MDDLAEVAYPEVMYMDYGNMVGESFEYAKDAVVGKWNKWLMLIIATLLLALPLMGYTMKVLRGEKPAPEVEDWGTLFIDGIKYLIVSLIYAIPLIIVWIIVIGASAVSIITGDTTAMMAAVGALALGLVIMLILGVIIAVFEVIGIVRFARTGSIGEAFNFNAILATIGKIGWGPYIISLIVLIIVGIIFGIIIAIIQAIPILGFIIYFCLIPPWALFIARYVCQIYDSAGAA